ncbi:hypothetical protein BD410DRAFT_789767 [Rickenella mellea]|uniref:Uncharacterized protein n=1 Tax=Rickenella mellea TaxID=50990 RepID=A0A4Y7Q289_9AGAM|nr:hypothetical protein BD410DRAFT_789767 [Rickenella mellea]
MANTIPNHPQGRVAFAYPSPVKHQDLRQYRATTTLEPPKRGRPAAVATVTLRNVPQPMSQFSGGSDLPSTVKIDLCQHLRRHWIR